MLKFNIITSMCTKHLKIYDKAKTFHHRMTFHSSLLRKTVDEKEANEENKIKGDERIYEIKKKKLEKLRNLGHNPYPVMYKTTHSLESIRKTFHSLEPGEKTNEYAVTKGMVVTVRRQSKKLYFVDIHEFNNSDVKLQLVINKRFYENEEEFSSIVECISRGDYIGASGTVMKTPPGELSLKVNNLQYISPCIQDLIQNLTQQEKRLSKRYLDLRINKNVRTRFETRSKIIKFIRKFLEDMNFLEVETPILSAQAAGAVAKPFTTFFECFDKNLHLRIAPELYLKQFLIGGFSKVFEISKQFRNESLDNTHHPEFTSCEFYMANSEYEELMEITEKMISEMVYSIFGKYDIYYKPHSYSEEHICINFKPPFKRVDLMAELEERLGVKLPEPVDLHTGQARNLFLNLCTQYDVYTNDNMNIEKLIDKLCDKVLVKEFVHPTFLINHPKVMSPFAKDHRSIKGLSERFELYISNLEICDAYSEQNDPFEQEKQIQYAKQSTDDKENFESLEKYLHSLTFGLPPTGGWGMGIDRLVMILTDSHTIKDVIAFPLLKE